LLQREAGPEEDYWRTVVRRRNFRAGSKRM